MGWKKLFAERDGKPWTHVENDLHRLVKALRRFELFDASHSNVTFGNERRRVPVFKGYEKTDSGLKILKGRGDTLVERVYVSLYLRTGKEEAAEDLMWYLVRETDRFAYAPKDYPSFVIKRDSHAKDKKFIQGIHIEFPNQFEETLYRTVHDTQMRIAFLHETLIDYDPDQPLVELPETMDFFANLEELHSRKLTPNQRYPILRDKTTGRDKA